MMVPPPATVLSKSTEPLKKKYDVKLNKDALTYFCVITLKFLGAKLAR